MCIRDREKEIIGEQEQEQEIVYDEFVEDADMEDVENEENEDNTAIDEELMRDADMEDGENEENEDNTAIVEELFDMSQLDQSLTPNRMKRTLNDCAKPIVWRNPTPPKDIRINSSLSDNEAEPLDHLFISKEQQEINDFCGQIIVNSKKDAYDFDEI